MYWRDQPVVLLTIPLLAFFTSNVICFLYCTHFRVHKILCAMMLFISHHVTAIIHFYSLFSLLQWTKDDARFLFSTIIFPFLNILWGSEISLFMLIWQYSSVSMKYLHSSLSTISLLTICPWLTLIVSIMIVILSKISTTIMALFKKKIALLLSKTGVLYTFDCYQFCLLFMFDLLLMHVSISIGFFIACSSLHSFKQKHFLSNLKTFVQLIFEGKI